MYLTWMYLPAHLTCTWHECIYQHILHVPDMNVFTSTSYMYLTGMYLPTHLTCTWHECIYQHILHVPDMNAFTHSFYVSIQVYDYDEIRICLFILLYLYYMQCTCIFKIKCVLCSEVRNCLLTLLYISFT
jgi:hypothetical protein